MLLWDRVNTAEIHELENQDRTMTSTNAFDLLILPMLQWTLATYAAFTAIWLAQAGFRRLFGTPRQRPAGTAARPGAYRPASGRAARPRLRVVGLSR